MRLIHINNENKAFYTKFENSEEILSYMSRIYPDCESSYLKWAYIEEDYRHIGSVWLEGKDTRLAKLGIFIADPAYRGKGIGALALQQMITIAKSDGVRVITLNVRVDNVYARKLYTACGFAVKDKIKKENGIEAFTMELCL